MVVPVVVKTSGATAAAASSAIIVPSAVFVSMGVGVVILATAGILIPTKILNFEDNIY